MVRWFRAKKTRETPSEWSTALVLCIREPLAFAVTECDTLPEVMADQVASVCDQLVKAVNVTMNAETSQVYRLEALKVASVFWNAN